VVRPDSYIQVQAGKEWPSRKDSVFK